MTELSKTAKVKKAFQLVNEINQAKTETLKGFLVIGRNLDIIQKEKLWGYYGEHITNFSLFLKEIGLKHATAWNCIRIYRVFGAYKNLEVLPDYFRLVKLLPVVNDTNRDEWIEKAKTLTPNDFNDEVQVAKGKISQLDCLHPDEEKEFYFRCRTCGKWVKIQNYEMAQQEKR